MDLLHRQSEVSENEYNDAWEDFTTRMDWLTLYESYRPWEMGGDIAEATAEMAGDPSALKKWTVSQLTRGLNNQLRLYGQIHPEEEIQKNAVDANREIRNLLEDTGITEDEDSFARFESYDDLQSAIEMGAAALGTKIREVRELVEDMDYITEARTGEVKRQAYSDRQIEKKNKFRRLDKIESDLAGAKEALETNRMPD